MGRKSSQSLSSGSQQSNAPSAAVNITLPPKPTTATGFHPHWVDAKPSAFQNPWPSYRSFTAWEMATYLPEQALHGPSISASKNAVPVVTPTWGASATGGTKVTWLGHACCLVELDNGVRVLFDPVFSDRCSPIPHMGPKRVTQPPCKVEEIPQVDAIVISHNHYDHLDTPTLTALYKSSSHIPHIFAPLGNDYYFESLGIPKSHYHTLDWWQDAEVTLPGSPSPSFKLTCTPAQHATGRGINDRLRTLWASWVLSTTTTTPPPTHIFFGGDTGYQAVRTSADEATAPICPAFKEIGERFGEIEFAMIPIGAYEPRWFMSPMHCGPQDSVRLFRDVRAKKAIGIHWGTWALTLEEVREPPRRLKEECEKAGIEDGAFGVCDIGDTVVF